MFAIIHLYPADEEEPKYVYTGEFKKITLFVLISFIILRNYSLCNQVFLNASVKSVGYA